MVLRFFEKTCINLAFYQKHEFFYILLKLISFFYNDDGLIPVEVKTDDNVSSKSLTVYMNRYKSEYAIQISSKNFGFMNNIKSVPLYATFLIR